MAMREILEELERETLSQWAAKSADSRGRIHPDEGESDVRTCYQRDVDKIIHSKPFRRLMHKTQVFLQPEGDHYRTRMTHTLEVSRISRVIARALRLNEDLTEAIALGHDLGHTPFGHAGETALSQATGKPFRHNEQSLRVVDVLANNGDGLNLTYETRMGILGHTGSRIPETLEGQIVRIADRIAYVNHDLDDALRAGLLQNKDIPKDIIRTLGDRHSERVNTLVCDMIACSQGGTICQSEAVAGAMNDLRNFMFQRVYRVPPAVSEEWKVIGMLKQLYTYYEENPQQLPSDFVPQLDFDGISRTICDYIAGMTDKYAIYVYNQIFIPEGWQQR
ncbi:MAG: deoxyguanosinetriphosphate triphosphohydrolase [Eubacteriales bacterium]